MKNQEMTLVRTLITLFAIAAIALAGSACKEENKKGDDKEEESTENTGDQNQGGTANPGGAENTNENAAEGVTAESTTSATPTAAVVASPTAAPAGALTAKPTATVVAPPTAALALVEGPPPTGTLPTAEAVAAPAAVPTAAGAAAPAIAVVEVPASAAPAISAAGGPHLGEWVMDLELSMPEASSMPPEQKEMMKNMMGSMSFKFTEDKLIMNAMGKTQEVGYSITKKNGGSMTIMMAPEHGGGGEAEMIVDGNKLTLTKPGQKQPMVLKRK